MNIFGFIIDSLQPSPRPGAKTTTKNGLRSVQNVTQDISELEQE